MATVKSKIIRRLRPLIESPIEAKLLKSLASLIELESQSRFAMVAKSPFAWAEPGNGELLSPPRKSPWPFARAQLKGIAISAQVRIGRYRADFAIQKVYFKAGEWGVGSTVLIECDGHKYHNLNDEQRARDVARDEHIQQLENVSILRLRGFEIWSRSDDCAAKALDELDIAAAGYSEDPVRIVGLEKDDEEQGDSDA